MPLNCCVPNCTSKGYRSTVGEKISYFSFPKSEELKKQWIRAIRRDDSDEGNGFNLKPSTKVCSRHFKETELNKSLNGIITLKKSSVPSKFSWTFRERTAPLDGQKPDSNVASINAFAVESKSGDGLSKEQIELKSINRALKEKIVALEAELSQKKC